MVTASTPIYDGDVFLGSVHHDLMVTELIERTLNDHLSDARNFIVRRDGRLIAHEDHFEDIKHHAGNYDIRAGGDEKLLDQFRIISETPSGDVATDEYDNYLAIVRIPGPDWWLITEYPRSLVRAQALNSAVFLFGAGILSLILVIFVLYSVLRHQISLPLLHLTHLTDRIADGEYGIKHDQKTKDELGMLGKSINKMSEVILERDQALARHNSDLENLIQERNRELDQQKAINLHGSKMSALGEMAGSVGQEMNGPIESLVAITAEIDGSLNLPQPDVAKARAGLKNINQVVERVSKIVASLKMFTRNASLDPFREANLQVIMKEVSSSYADRCRRRGIELSTGISDRPIKIQCRSDELSQVIEHSEHVEIRITDSGPGISAKLQKKIFLPFFTTKRLGHGGGVGLSISAGIIKSHGGRLGIDNSSANTCFVISLPKSDTRPMA